VDAADRMLRGNGRLLIRESGTEPVVRVMAESEDDVLVQPGWLFDLDPAEHAGAAHLVLSLLPEPARFAAAAQRLVAGCARWRRTGA
jgi:hypothetical protein